MKKIIFIIGLIGAGFLAYHAVSNKSVEIQNDITTRLAQNFAAQNVSGNISTEVSGRDVTLTGNVSDEQSKKQAGQLASNLEGVRAVNNEIQVIEPPTLTMAEPTIPAVPVIEDTPESIFDLDITPAEDVAVTVEDTVADEPISIVTTEPVVELPSVIKEEPLVAVDNVELDKPLPITNKRIIRRGVDSITALKTVEAKCEGSLTSLLEGQKINFESGLATIKRSSYDLLDRTVITAKNCHEDTIITINGYTDNTGDMQANRRLSLQRARAVGKYMLKRGVAKQVKVVGHGPNDPIASNETEEGRAQNRRIEFKVFKKED